MRKILAAIAVTAALAGCALGTTNVTLSAPEGKKGVLSEAPPARIHVVPVVDARERTDRIGDKRNGYGAVMGAVGAAIPPTETMQRTLEQAVSANGHTLGGAEDSLALEASLSRFWFDYKTGLVTVEFFGDVQAELALKDRATGRTLYSESIQGFYTEKTGGGLSATWTRILNATLADFAQKVSMSEELKDAITAAQQPPQTAAAPEAPPAS